MRSFKANEIGHRWDRPIVQSRNSSVKESYLTYINIYICTNWLILNINIDVCLLPAIIVWGFAGKLSLKLEWHNCWFRKARMASQCFLKLLQVTTGTVRLHFSLDPWHPCPCRDAAVTTMTTTMKVMDTAMRKTLRPPWHRLWQLPCNDVNCCGSDRHYDSRRDTLLSNFNHFFLSSCHSVCTFLQAAQPAMFGDVSFKESMSGTHWSGLDTERYVAFKPPLLRRKCKKPKLHDGPEPWHVVALLWAREEPSLHPQGGEVHNMAQAYTEARYQYPQTWLNAIKHMFCHFSVLLHDDPL